MYSVTKEKQNSSIDSVFDLTVVPVLLNLTVEGMKFDTCMALENGVQQRAYIRCENRTWY